MFASDGVSSACICNNSKELIQGKFYQKLKDAAEREIRKLKKGACHELLQSRAPKHLWEDCFELEAYVRSNSTHNIYMLDGEVLKTVMSGETPDISQCCEVEWFKWLMLWDETTPFPDNALKWGYYLEPTTDVGAAMTAKILLKNGQA